MAEGNKQLSLDGLAPVVQRTRRRPPKLQIQVRFLAGALDRLGVHPDWRRRVHSTGYVAVYCPDHPRAWSTGYVYEHALAMEAIIGRFLRPDEQVHHLNGDKHDNRCENLELHTASSHHHVHAAAQSPKILTLTCDECGVQFRRSARQRAEVKGYRHAFCSRSCNGRFRQKAARAA